MQKSQRSHAIYFAGLIFLSALMIETWASGCGKSGAPNTLYEQIVHSVGHGDLNTSLTDVEKALHHNEGHAVDWYWRFLVRKEPILIALASCLIDLERRR